jgi:hypothetical protein
MEAVERLSASEGLALAGLLRVLIRYDREFSEAERGALSLVASSVAVEGTGASPIGEEALYALMERAGDELVDDASIRAAAVAVTRPEARATIHAMLFEVAASDMISRLEGSLLDWLAETWELEAPADLPGEETDAG